VKTGIIIQARTGSKRLPNKMVVPFFNNQGVLEIIIKRLQKKYPDTSIYLATTTNTSDNILEEIAKNNNIFVFRGSENNVLSRFVTIADNNNFDYLIRVCADNPFLDVAHISKLIKYAKENKNIDYISYGFDDTTPVIKTHLGLYTELVKTSALKEVEKFTQEKIYLEHVTNYVHSHPKIFSVKLLPLQKKLQNREDVRLTLDTKEDFEIHQDIWKNTNAEKNININNILEYIDGNYELSEKMKTQIIENSK